MTDQLTGTLMRGVINEIPNEWLHELRNEFPDALLHELLHEVALIIDLITLTQPTV